MVAYAAKNLTCTHFTRKMGHPRMFSDPLPQMPGRLANVARMTTSARIFVNDAGPHVKWSGILQSKKVVHPSALLEKTMTSLVGMNCLEMR